MHFLRKDGSTGTQEQDRYSGWDQSHRFPPLACTMLAGHGADACVSSVHVTQKAMGATRERVICIK
jgi:hypothetical protein